MKIDIITSIVDGLAEEPVLKIDGKIVNDFNWHHFDWDVYNYEDTASFIGGLHNANHLQAKEFHSKLIKGEDNG